MPSEDAMVTTVTRNVPGMYRSLADQLRVLEERIRIQAELIEKADEDYKISQAEGSIDAVDDLGLDAYKELGSQFAKYPDIGRNLWYPALGLGGESGEVENQVKKVYRDHGGNVPDRVKDKLADELGDILWYVAALCGELNISLAYVAKANLAKLANRKKSGAIGGSGETVTERRDSMKG